jgi:hypothetical protein
MADKVKTIRLRYYTNNKGLEGIKESMKINAYDQKIRYLL